MEPGKMLKNTREQLGLTVRDVAAQSGEIAQRRKNQGFLVPGSRLTEIENKGVVPSAYRFYSLSVIYHRDIRELLRWYGIDVNETALDSSLAVSPKSHLTDASRASLTTTMPTTMAAGFDPVRTMNMGSLVKEWGTVPFSYLKQFSDRTYSYGYVGAEDFTMYPILPPGSFVQIDESKNKVVDGPWRSEYDRPIYFVETRDGYKCCWCSVQSGFITLQPHPLSPERVKTVRYPLEVDIIGQVVGVAMRLSDRGSNIKHG